MVTGQTKDNKAILEKILLGARWSVGLRLTAQIISWISTICVVRFIRPDDYGLNSMLEATLELMLLFSTLGLDVALVRLKALAIAEMRSAFGLLLLINGVLFLIYFLGAPLIAAYFHAARLESLCKALAFIFILLPFRVIPNALLNRDLKFKLQSTVELLASIATAVVTLILAVRGEGVWALVIGALVNRALLVIMLMIIRPWFIRPSLNLIIIRDMLAFGGMTTLWAGSVLIADKLAALIGGPVLGVEILGIFTVAMQFSVLPQSKAMPIINPILFPAFSKFRDQPAVAANYFEKLLGVISLGLFPLMIGNACIAHVFIPTILGYNWSGVINPLIVLSIVMPCRMISSLLRPVMSAMGRVDLSLKSALMMIFALLLLIPFGSRYDALGLAAAISLAEFIVMVATIRICNAALRTSFLKIAVCLRPAIIGSIIMAGCIYAVRSGFGLGIGFADLVIDILVGALSYYLALRLFFKFPLKLATSLLFHGR